jgi:beta-glucosidase
LWGTATAAHQTEGGNTNTDWWDFEHRPDTNCFESSGDACDSWHRWPEDVAIVADLGLSAYRFSVEWARVEPADGEISYAALAHYRAMAQACVDRGITPIVTLHHFTNPRWVAAQGGWEWPGIVDRFASYAGVVAGELADLVPWFCTINEPNAFAAVGWMNGKFPPGRADDYAGCWAAMEIQRAAHAKAVTSVRAGAPLAKVGLTLSMADFQAAEGGEDMVLAARKFMEDSYLEQLGGDDFVGVQVYTRTRMGPTGEVAPPEDAELVQMGYEFWPEALEACLRRTWKVTGGLPMLVTENGIGTADDDQRIRYVERALAGVRRCLDDGLVIPGYCYWSLLDNFEWDDGFRKTFGLVAVDRTTFTRTVKPSAKWYGEVARRNGLSDDRVSDAAIAGGGQ